MNKSSLKVSLDDSDWIRVREKIQNDAADWRPAGKKIHQDMIVRTDSMFSANRMGGTHRGETWAYFADQYTRKTDGVVVPAWGGVQKLRGRGKVKGRLRPSGSRVSFGDSVGQDIGHLRRAALISRRLTRNALIMGGNVEYGAAFNKHRRYAFFHLPDDLKMIRQHIIEHFER